MMARKEKNTNMERNIGKNLEYLLSKAVDKYVEVEIPEDKRQKQTRHQQQQ